MPRWLGTAAALVASFADTFPVSRPGLLGAHGGNECGRLGDAVLLTVVGLFEATFDGDDSLRAGHL
jgi:hypothetical protein